MILIGDRLLGRVQALQMNRRPESSLPAAYRSAVDFNRLRRVRQAGGFSRLTGLFR
jgi:hypothetical protein